MTIAEIFNTTVEKIIEKREEESRNREFKENTIWASEIGKAPIDVYLRLKQIEKSNQPNLRARRKMLSSKMFEFQIKQVLRLAGLYDDEEKYITYEHDLVTVSGYLDVQLSDKVARTQVEQALRTYLPILPPEYAEAVGNIARELAKGNHKKTIVEIKSVAGQAFNNYEISAGDHHLLQLYHYVRNSSDVDRGILLYYSKDDARMVEYEVLDKSHALEDKYVQFIEQIEKALKTDTPPAKEPLVYFDEGLAKFKGNWKVFYSDWLTYLYGYEHAEEARKEAEKISRRYNAVLKAQTLGKKLTKLQSETYDLMLKEMGEEEFSRVLGLFSSNYNEQLEATAVVDEAEAEGLVEV